MADNMQELKQQKIWMLWRWETKPDGKRTKVPMSVSGGPCGTDKKWCSTWATYDEAAAAKKPFLVPPVSDSKSRRATTS